MRLQDQVAIVTGGGDGIGRAIAKALTAEGARLVLTGRRAHKLEETAAEIRQARGGATEVLCLAGDVSQEGHVRVLTRAALDRFGRIDILVNNAGITGPTEPVEKIETTAWDEVMAVNLRGPFLMCREAIPYMLRADRGCIINIASVAGRMGYPVRSPYAASKWGLIGFSRTLAVEVGSTNVRVNTVCPGAIMGERLAGVIQAFGRYVRDDENPRLKTAVGHVRASKLLPPEDIASTCVFLASEEGHGVSGQEIVVAGVTG